MNAATLARALVGLLALALASGPSAAAAPRSAEDARPPGLGPPPGWEAPPPPAEVARRSPACCAYDELCCERQVIVDAVGPPGGLRQEAIDTRDLPVATVETAQGAAAGIQGAPSVRAIDGRGRPTPWTDAPWGEVRVMPPGHLGEITWGDAWSPYFRDEAARQMGYGVVRTESLPPGDQALRGMVDFTTFSSGADHTVEVDRVIGVLRGSTAVDAELWEHVAARPVLGGSMHAYVRDAKGPREIVLVLPEVVRHFESRSVELQGGFVPSRFSRTEAFTRVALPAAPGGSGTVRFELLASQVRHWFPRAPLSRAPSPRAVFVVASSQTRAERTPRVRVFERAEPTSFD